MPPPKGRAGVPSPGKLVGESLVCLPWRRESGVPSPLNVITPRAHARARGYVIGRGVYILLYIIYYKSALFFGTNLLSPKILTFRGPI